MGKNLQASLCETQQLTIETIKVIKTDDSHAIVEGRGRSQASLSKPIISLKYGVFLLNSLYERITKKNKPTVHVFHQATTTSLFLDLVKDGTKFFIPLFHLKMLEENGGIKTLQAE